MINGSAKEFIEGLHCGDERFFFYNNKKYFIEGWNENEKLMLILYVVENPNDNFEWQAVSKDKNYTVAEFENAKILGDKSFWEVEKDMECVVF